MTRSMRIGEFLKESRIPGTSGDIARKITVKLYGKGVFAKQENRPGSENTSYYKRKTGQFIYSKLDFLNGAFGIVPDDLDGYESTVDLPCFDFTSIEIHPEWFLHFVSRRDFYSYQGGLGNGGRKARRISPDDFLELEIDVPPLPEQKKIAEILSGIDTTIAKLKLKAQKLDALQFSLAEELAEVLHRDGEASALQEFAEIRTGIAKNSNNEGDMAELPYMRVANVQDGYLDLSEIKTINVDKSRIARYLIQKGDVLINEGGDLDKVGRGVIWHGEIRECLHQNHVFAVRCSERLMPEFLSLLLKTSYSKNYFLGCAKQTTNLASINSTQLKSFPIPLPSLSAQKEFVNHITSTKQLTSSVSRKISSLAAMKNAISSDLLSGRKRVTV